MYVSALEELLRVVVRVVLVGKQASKNTVVTLRQWDSFTRVVHIFIVSNQKFIILSVKTEIDRDRSGLVHVLLCGFPQRKMEAKADHVLLTFVAGG